MEDFVIKDVVHVREILRVDDLSQAERILNSLKANRNSNFAELARVHSKAATAEDGGDMGRIERGELPGEFEKVVFPMTPGTVSKIVRTRYGYHVFLVEERIGAHQQKLYEVRDQIHEKLLAARQRCCCAYPTKPPAAEAAHSMSTSLQRVMSGMMAACLALALTAGYWGLARSGELASRDDNPRFVIAEARVVECKPDERSKPRPPAIGVGHRQTHPTAVATLVQHGAHGVARIESCRRLEKALAADRQKRLQVEARAVQVAGEQRRVDALTFSALRR